MKNWLKKFKYRTVYVATIKMVWKKSKDICGANIIFKENGFGKRLLEKEGKLYPPSFEGRYSLNVPYPIEQHSYWVSVAVPWREGLISTEQLQDIATEKL